MVEETMRRIDDTEKAAQKIEEDASLSAREKIETAKREADRLRGETLSAAITARKESEAQAKRDAAEIVKAQEDGARQSAKLLRAKATPRLPKAVSAVLAALCE